jgi:hypothetical protein
MIAKHDFSGEAENELTFKKGDIITILKSDTSGWSQGELNGKRGWFPSSYAVRFAEEVPKKPTPKAPIPATPKEKV